MHVYATPCALCETLVVFVVKNLTTRDKKGGTRGAKRSVHKLLNSFFPGSVPPRRVKKMLKSNF